MNSPFKTIAEVKAGNIAIGNHFFDQETMKFFNSYVCSELIKGRYFVTSEYRRDIADKKYSVRMVHNNGTITTIFKFNSFLTLSMAKKAIKGLPDQFYDAYESAYTQAHALPLQGMSFTDFASIEPANSRDQSFGKESFTGACSYLVANYQKLDVLFIEPLIKGNELLTNLNLSNAY